MNSTTQSTHQQHTVGRSGSDAVIFALATGAGRAAIAVMRVTGRNSGEILSALCNGKLPTPRIASLRTLRVYDQDECVDLDRALVLWLPGPANYTGEDSFELHLHAGSAVVNGVSDALVMLGARPAEAGEFTRRAFANGRLDLLQAEGIADLIEAETTAQRKQALSQSDGALSRVYNGWASRLRLVLAQQEALIDFPDEELPQDVEDALLKEVSLLAQEMDEHLSDGARGEKLRNGLVFAIAGAPNAGKSSLLNELAGRDAAIVSEVEGTTRDAIEVRVVLGGVPVTVVDTAGLRETENPIEAEGIRRAMFHVKQADCVIQLFEGSAAPERLSDETFLIQNKIDASSRIDGVLGISVRTGEGVGELRELLTERARALTSQTAHPPLTRARHRAGIAEACAALRAALGMEWPEMRGEELRLAMRALGRLTGHIGVEELLDTVFGQFCIGK